VVEKGSKNDQKLVLGENRVAHFMARSVARYLVVSVFVEFWCSQLLSMLT